VRLLSRTTVFLVYAFPSSTVLLLIVIQAEIRKSKMAMTQNPIYSKACIKCVHQRIVFLPFLFSSLQHSQNSRPRPQQRPGRLKKLRLAMTKSPHPPPPTTRPPVTAATTSKTNLRHLFTQPSHYATPPVVDVPFAKGKGCDRSIIIVNVSCVSDA
jgi:hypothetical protein